MQRLTCTDQLQLKKRELKTIILVHKIIYEPFSAVDATVELLSAIKKKSKLTKTTPKRGEKTRRSFHKTI